MPTLMVGLIEIVPAVSLVSCLLFSTDTGCFARKVETGNSILLDGRIPCCHCRQRRETSLIWIVSCGFQSLMMACTRRVSVRIASPNCLVTSCISIYKCNHNSMPAMEISSVEPFCVIDGRKRRRSLSAVSKSVDSCWYKTL